jgi:hypothetical protein
MFEHVLPWVFYPCLKELVIEHDPERPLRDGEELVVFQVAGGSVSDLAFSARL